MTDHAIELRGVSKSFGPTPVLEHVDLAVEKHALLGVIGPNGGGKTVLLKLILGLLRPDSGEIRVLGQRPSRARVRVGYVPQYTGFDRQFPINVTDVVLTGRQCGGRLFQRYGRADRQMAAAALEQVDMLPHKDRQIGKLSGGQLQRALIARALVTEPDILLLDEPTANLDPHSGQTIYALLAKLKERMTVVLVSHDIGVISTFVTAVACVNRRLYQHKGGEPPQDLLEKTYNCPVHVMPTRSNSTLLSASEDHKEETC
ncbi:MAG: ABC transporter ATP-binding protein [Myxococcota bacterium]|nr:ABC transporter ATP-binding protein [Myxococcota bacterium]